MLSIRNLEVVYHSVMLVLRGLSLDVPEGAIVALLGPNGAGKTTLLRAVSGLLAIHDGTITKGDIELFGEPVFGRTAPERVRRGLGQVMEGRRILPTLTVEENLRAGAFSQPRRAVREGIERAFERFAVLKERRTRAAGFLSGGEQQMLAFARALMSSPQLLLLDEPSLGLAPKIQADVARTIQEIHAAGVSVLLVEQNADLALDLASHGYVMENGKIVLDGPSSELRSDRDIRDFYLGAGAERTSYRHVKHYRRRKRWLS